MIRAKGFRTSFLLVPLSILLTSGIALAGWAKTYGSSDNDIFGFVLEATGGVNSPVSIHGVYSSPTESIQQTPDGGYIATGFYKGFAGGGAWVLKLDGSGDIEWQKAFSSSVASSVQQAVDGGYIVAGSLCLSSSLVCLASVSSATPTSYPWVPWVLKLDINGNIQWQRILVSNNGGNLKSIRQTADGGYIAAGGTGPADAFVLKLDSWGNVQWQTTYSMGSLAISIQQTPDSGFIMAGRGLLDFPGHVGHRFRRIPATHSDLIRPLIPEQSGHFERS